MNVHRSEYHSFLEYCEPQFSYRNRPHFLHIWRDEHLFANFFGVNGKVLSGQEMKL